MAKILLIIVIVLSAFWIICSGVAYGWVENFAVFQEHLHKRNLASIRAEEVDAQGVEMWEGYQNTIKVILDKSKIGILISIAIFALNQSLIFLIWKLHSHSGRRLRDRKESVKGS